MGIRGRRDPEGLGSYYEEWAFKGRGDPKGLGSYCEQWRGTLRGWVRIAGNMVIMIMVV